MVQYLEKRRSEQGRGLYQTDRKPMPVKRCGGPLTDGARAHAYRDADIWVASTDGCTLWCYRRSKRNAQHSKDITINEETRC